MRRIFAFAFTIGALAACSDAPPSVVNHPLADHVMVDDHKIYVIPQANNTWAAWGGEEGKDGLFIQYRQKRAIEVQSKCRIQKVVSQQNQPMLKATVYQCRGR